MNASGFIASRLRFKGRIAIISIAVSFLVMIIAVAISSGFRREIREGVSSFCGDVQLTPVDMNYISDNEPIGARPSYLGALDSLQGVEAVVPAVYRAGIVKKDDNIHGVLFKGLPAQDSLAGLGVRVPSRLADMLHLDVGDPLLAYFVSDKIRMRKFTIREIYKSVVDADETLLVYTAIEDLQRLNGWEEDEVSVLEVTLKSEYKSAALMDEMKGRIGTLVLSAAEDSDDDTLVATSVMEKYPQLFDWLNLIDFNVLFILLLMTVVAGFNMISGLLIMLFRSISTIGILKSMGMTDKSISSVFLKVSSNLVLKGMAVGNALALLFCLVQGTTHVLKLNPENYFIPFVPVHVNIPFILAADILAYAVIMLLLQIPVRFIAKVDPAQSVRSQ